MQTKVVPQALGRVFSMYYTLSIIPILFSLAATGFLADTFGVGKLFVALGIAMAVVAVAAFLPKSSIQLDRQ